MNYAPVADPPYTSRCIHMALDAIELTRLAERLVLTGNKRKYYRFRGDRWYGGVATGDVVGCNLRCIFCWSRSREPSAPGRFYTPEEVVQRLASIAERRKYRQVRLSGGEPTLGWWRHTRRTAETILEDYKLHFILETNGILIGLDRRIAKDIANLAAKGSIEVRVSVKGATPETFEKITLMDKKYWETQIKALEYLVDAGLKPGDEVYPAIVMSFDKEHEIESLIKRIAAIHPALAQNIDPEYVILYPHVRRRLERLGVKPYKFFRPGEPLPEWMI